MDEAVEAVDQGGTGGAGVTTLGIHERIDDQRVLAGCKQIREARLSLVAVDRQVCGIFGQHIILFQRAAQGQGPAQRSHFLDLGAQLHFGRQERVSGRAVFAGFVGETVVMKVGHRIFLYI